MPEHTTKMWEGLTLLQNAPAIPSVSLPSWASASDTEDESAEEAPSGPPEVVEFLMPVGPPSSVADVGGPCSSVRDLLWYEPVQMRLSEGERILWGPTMFDVERAPWLRCRLGRIKVPSALVTITTCRIAVVQFVAPQTCVRLRQCLFAPRISSVVFVPLHFVVGFFVEESFTYQRFMMARIIGRCLGYMVSDSLLTARILTNAGLGKVYLDSLCITQRLFPNSGASQFEEQRVLELRRWLGHVALFNGETAPGEKLDLIQNTYGWAPL
uniref:Uncharacterized protein n=1 Tax=Noctiluca scintillans TaxID=2966 RepID=A0A7S1AGB1_NOCSC